MILNKECVNTLAAIIGENDVEDLFNTLHDEHGVNTSELKMTLETFNELFAHDDITGDNQYDATMIEIGANVRCSSKELALDLASFASALMKLGFDDIVTNQKLFVEVCNESGFRTVTGLEFSQMSFRQVFGRLGSGGIAEVAELFAWGADYHGNESTLESIYI